jgi:Reverse transcriptase (RNA-dependent DNA polymerase)
MRTRIYDQSYNYSTLADMLRHHDFSSTPKSAWDAFREKVSIDATLSANTIFHGLNPLIKFHLKKKAAYRIMKLADELVVRKLAQNIRHITDFSSPGRTNLVRNLRHFLDEGVPYRIYRLDVQQFYESFSSVHVRKSVMSLSRLSPLSKLHALTLLDHYSLLGGVGLPRGMPLSAVLSDLMMQDFDSQVYSHPCVYFYGRYVDDIVLVTNLTENEEGQLSWLAGLLPVGLKINFKKTTVRTVDVKCKVANSSADAAIPKFTTEYLGYQFSVYDPIDKKGKKDKKSQNRVVVTEIAHSKVKKIKTRLVRIFVDFEETANAHLLIDRIKYLTSNFSVIDKNTTKKKLAGVYYGYPSLSPDSKTLEELDQFLRNAVLSRKGRLFKKWRTLATPSLTRKVLSHSFKRGYEARQFVHFSSKRIGEIQKCWKYE